MSNPRQQREEELFHACLELTPAEWSSYLNQACNDDSNSHDRLKRLLAAHRNAESAPVNHRRSFPADRFGLRR